MKQTRLWLSILLIMAVMIEVPIITLYYLWPMMMIFTDKAKELLIVLVGLFALAGLQWSLWPVLIDKIRQA